jgi:ankyrin repeat protein
MTRFLLACLHIDSLRDKLRKREVLSTLNNLSKGLTALDDAYVEATKRIDGQLPGQCSLAKRTISWITNAKRPFTTAELCHAVSIELDDTALEDVYDVEDILSVCAGLVAVDKESNIIRLVHYTTEEYFKRVLLEWNPNNLEEIALACLTYLSFDAFRNGSCDDDKYFEQRLATNPFFDYAARYWSDHIRPVEITASHLALGLLCDDAIIDSIVQAIYVSTFKRKGYSTWFPKSSKAVHLTARYGLLYLTEKFVEDKHGENIEADSRDLYYQTPLSLAARHGHESIVKLLLSSGRQVDADSKDSYYQTPLSWAARHGHESIVKLLLSSGRQVDADSKDSSGRTPLSFAASRGHESIVKLLLSSGRQVDADSKDSSGWTPLSLAASRGHESIVKLLLSSGQVDADSKGSDGWTPLSLAASRGHESIVKLLLSSGQVDADSKGSSGWTTLSWAARTGHESIVKLLLSSGQVDADSKDSSGWTTLSWAVVAGHESIVKLLLSSGQVDADSKDSNGRTPLSWAAAAGHKSIVKLLLSSGQVDADSKGSNGRTPLSWAADAGHESIVKLKSYISGKTVG